MRGYGIARELVGLPMQRVHVGITAGPSVAQPNKLNQDRRREEREKNKGGTPSADTWHANMYPTLQWQDEKNTGARQAKTPGRTPLRPPLGATTGSGSAS